MEKTISWKMKKYLFFVSIVFLLVILSHLIYIYIYNDAETTPVKGGNISEGILWTTINLNPFSNANDENKTIMRLVHRSLLKYNPENGNFEKDLANCDIKNLKNIECYFEEWPIWSDGTNIEINDVFLTYTRIKEVESDKTIYPFLQDVKITKNENKIIFSSDNSDINHIKMLLQPIVKWEIVSAMTAREMTTPSSNPLQYTYSWPYIISAVTNDETTGIRSVILNRNKKNKNDQYHIDKMSFRFFKDPNDLVKYKSMINVFNDTENILWEYSPRIETYEYKLPKITSIFVNSDTLEDKNLRGFILEKINRDDIIAALWENYTKTMNPFGTETDTNTDIENKDLSSLIAQFEYYSKSTIVDYLLTDEQKEKIAEEEAWKYRENPDLTFQFSPYTKKYNFVEKDNILLEGKVDEGTQAVYMNDYKLTGFSEWDTKFYFRLEEDSYETIEKWINEFEIIFENAEWEKVTKESFIVAYNPNTEILNSYKDDLLGIEEVQTYSAEAVIETLTEEEKELKKKLDDLDDNFFYNRDLNKFSVTLAYIKGNLNLEKTAGIIKNTLETFGIFVELKPISSSLLATNLAEGKNEYDVILVGLNLWYFNYDLFPYLHSSQSKTGYNLANYEKSSLDESLELLRERSLTQNEEKEQKDNIIKILQEEQILKSIYQPNERLLVDKNIKNFKFWNYLPDYSERVNYLRGVYTLEQKDPDLEKKSFLWFISFLFSQLF